MVLSEFVEQSSSPLTNQKQTMSDPMLEHKCRIIARISPIGEGREVLVGELLEPIPGYPTETHCIHVTTPAKQIVFGVNAGDAACLAVICQIIHGRSVNGRWLDSMEAHYRAQIQACL